MFRRLRMLVGFLSLPFFCSDDGVALDLSTALSLSMNSAGYTAEILRGAGSSTDDSWLEGISVYLRTWKRGSPRIVGFNFDEHAIHVDGFESSVIDDESTRAGIAIDRFSSSNRERIAYYPLDELTAFDSSSVGTLRGAPLSGNVAVMLFDHNARLVDEVWLGDSRASYSGNTDLWRGARLSNGEDISGYVRTASKNTRSAWDWRQVYEESTLTFPRIAEEIAREVALEFEVQSATAERAVVNLGHFPTNYLLDEIVVLDGEESLIARVPLREFRKGRVQLRAPGGVASFSESEPDVVFELEAILAPPLSTDSEIYFSVASEGEFEMVPSISAVAGQDRVRISVSPIDDTIIDGETLSIVRCWSPGYEVGELALYNRDDEVGELRFQRRPSFRRHYEGDGYSYGEYSVVLSEVATDPVVVRLESDGVLDIVDQVIVWPGNSVSDDVAFILPDDEFSVYRKQSYSSSITASVASWPIAEAVLEIRENDLEIQGVQLRIDSDVLREGETITGAFELALPTADDVTFGIASNSTIQASPSFVCAATVIIPHQRQLFFPIDEVCRASCESG